MVFTCLGHWHRCFKRNLENFNLFYSLHGSSHCAVTKLIPSPRPFDFVYLRCAPVPRGKGFSVVVRQGRGEGESLLRPWIFRTQHYLKCSNARVRAGWCVEDEGQSSPRESGSCDAGLRRASSRPHSKGLRVAWVLPCPWQWQGDRFKVSRVDTAPLPDTNRRRGRFGCFGGRWGR
jgi:hypothetical protein